jgi:hypothetical protein
VDAEPPHGSTPVSRQPHLGSGATDATVDPTSGPECRFGFAATDLVDLDIAPDDLADLLAMVQAASVPFHGAHVPLVVHQPSEAERAYDAAEWAADLIRSAGGKVLALTPCADATWTGASLTPRQWNHTAAMTDRLETVCRRFGIDLAVSETVEGRPVRPEGGLDPDRPLRHLLDAGGFLTDGYRPVQLVCPGPLGGPSGLVDRLRGLLRDRG